MHGKVRLLAVHGHHLDGLAWKYPQTLAKVRRKVRTPPARPLSLPRRLRPGAARTGLAAGMLLLLLRMLLLRMLWMLLLRLVLMLLPRLAASEPTAQSARAQVSRSRFSKSSSPARRRAALLLHLNPTSRGRPGELSRELAAPPR